MKAQAVVFDDRNQVLFREVEIPEPGERDVVVEVEYSWISIGTESSFLRGERISGEVPYRPGDPWPFPIAAGYQKVGRAVQVGSAVTHIKPGDRVFATVSWIKGMHFDFAGHVNPAVTDGGQVWKLPEGVSPIAFSGAVLTQVGYNCGSRPPVQRGESAVVIGDGLVGQWAAQTLHARGAAVYILGHREERLRLAEAGGYAVALNGRSVDPAAELRGAGASVGIVVDTVGSLDTFRRLQPLMKHDSHLVSAGYLGENGAIDIQTLREQEITLHSPSGWSTPRMDETIRGIAEGWLRTESLITHRFPAGDAAKAWQLITAKGSPCLGVVLEW
ncbi:zinc-binding dehydrogenase [Paenibacillus sacheonensis]|uniref:Zinc-binding dehydrogenase n=1 Tax=Paenibacillus sacheonensis TaxID=742054 RepID=A0A7X4YWP8_9BACL|nr:zinc-binding dehydrogenase [Paenibacillus sacheonensis]MBM7567284.1 2-desacetyl-2-hydroxyethyl bacteriochlorophyllide A dehydrogenase [Paenibacillus sacheonensis]NBC72824.1 zinc-binding dehydrogenase [Paenibacillus sacheonensis]